MRETSATMSSMGREHIDQAMGIYLRVCGRMGRKMEGGNSKARMDASKLGSGLMINSKYE